jgi:hypothetical protein
MLRSAFVLFVAACTSSPARSPSDSPGDSNAAGGGDTDVIPTGDDDPGTCAGQCLVDRATDGCEDFFDELCDFIFRCYEGPELDDIEGSFGFNDEATCPAAVAGEICSDESLGQAVRDGRQRLDATPLQTCLSTIRALACLPFGEFFSHPRVLAACESVPRGLVQSGGSCEMHDDCAGAPGYCNDTGHCESRGEADYEIECENPISDGDCPADSCLTLLANQQDMTGVCTRPCSADAECGYQGLCVDSGGSAGMICFSTCLTNADCGGGLICIVGQGSTVGICAVEPL